MLQLGYPLASAMCIYQVCHAVLGGSVGERMRSMLPRLEAHVRRLLPEPANAEATLTIADTDPVRMAASSAYHTLFSVGSAD